MKTNCGRLFRRNREAINLDKSLPQQQSTIKVPVQLKITRRTEARRVQTSNFIYDFEVQQPVPQHNPANQPNQENGPAAEEETPLEPYVEATVEDRTGVHPPVEPERREEDQELPTNQQEDTPEQQPEAVRGRQPKSQQSLKKRRSASAHCSRTPSHPNEPPDENFVRVTRSGLQYGVAPKF